MTEWHLYLVRTGDGALYTGIATDVGRRFAEHQAGGKRSAKYLRSRGPIELVYQTPIGSRPLALKVEARVKSLAKAEKEKIVAKRVDRERLLEILAVAGIEERRPDDLHDTTCERRTS